MASTYVTVAILYVNADPHLGYAYELVQADICARSRRDAGDTLRGLAGTAGALVRRLCSIGCFGKVVWTVCRSNASDSPSARARSRCDGQESVTRIPTSTIARTKPISNTAGSVSGAFCGVKPMTPRDNDVHGAW